MADLLLFLPWMILGLYMVLFVRTPPRISKGGEGRGGEMSVVSIIIPARNEEENIGPLLRSLVAQEYPSFEIVVVDDQSQDRTGELVLEIEQGNARRIHLVEGRPLPEGWFGKPWACHQGFEAATGEVLLFTDADTVHAPSLLGQAVAALEREKADALTLVGRQVMGSFWERLLQPQFFMLLALRFPRTATPRSPRRWRHAIANGQYLLFRREAYEDLGGHGAVRGEVVEDMRLAQLLVRGGWRLVVREGRGLQTRMYRSLADIVEGWSKNITTGALQATAGWLIPFILPLSVVVGTALWLLPPVVLGWALLSGSQGTPLLFGAATTGFGVVFWAIASALMGVNPFLGLLYPLGSVLSAFIFLLSWFRGNRIQWKGRSYSMSQETRRGKAIDPRVVEDPSPNRSWGRPRRRGA